MERQGDSEDESFGEKCLWWRTISPKLDTRSEQKGGWQIVKGGEANRKEIKRVEELSQDMLKHASRTESLWESGALGLQQQKSFWWWQGSGYHLEVEWREETSLEMRRSRKLRSQAARGDIVWLLQWDCQEGLCRKKDGEPGGVVQWMSEWITWMRTCDRVVQSGSQSL